jgi:hypothetical protein
MLKILFGFGPEYNTCLLSFQEILFFIINFSQNMQLIPMYEVELKISPMNIELALKGYSNSV